LCRAVKGHYSDRGNCSQPWPAHAEASGIELSTFTLH
jgi:hypothetical protein